MNFLLYTISLLVLNHTNLSEAVFEKSNNCSPPNLRCQTGKTYYVLAIHGLNLRSTPSANGQKIKTIPCRDSVTVLGYEEPLASFSVNEFKGFDINGYWVKVKSGNDIGYVFDGYLSRYKSIDKSLNLNQYFQKCFEKLKADYHIKTEFLSDDDGRISYFKLPNGVIKFFSGSSKGGFEAWQFPIQLISREEIYLLLNEQYISPSNIPDDGQTLQLKFVITKSLSTFSQNFIYNGFAPEDGVLSIGEGTVGEDVFTQGDYVIYLYTYTD